MNLRKLRKYRRIFYLLAIILIVIIFVGIHKSYVNTICADIKVVIEDSSKELFITKNEIIQYLIKDKNYDIVGSPFKSINLADIENDLDQNYFVKKAEVFRNDDDILEIHIAQRIPVLRIFDSQGYSYYIDRDGNFIPLSKNYTAYVPVARGNIPHLDSLFTGEVRNVYEKNIDKIFQDAFVLVKRIKKDNFVNGLLDQIIVDDKKEFEIIPKIGEYKIIVGTIDDLDTKIRNLKAFYSQAGPKTGWNSYSYINLKFENQIVCTKK